MTSFTDPTRLIGQTAYDRDGDKVGKIGQVYLDDQTGEPAWVTVSTGLFGNRESFAPLHGASPQDGGDVRLAVDKATIKDAPNVEDDGHLEENEQSALYDHYAQYIGAGARSGGPTTGRTDEVRETAGDRVEGAGDRVGTDRTDGDRVQGTVGHDTSGPTTDDAMTRSEEQLHVGTEKVEAGRARLRKYVVTENVQQTVPVSHEEVRVEREPITEGNRGAAYDGPAISEEEHEVTLHAERPVVEKEAVPVERVRLGTETVTDEQQVNEEVRKEQIDTDGVEGGRDRTV